MCDETRAALLSRRILRMEAIYSLTEHILLVLNWQARRSRCDIDTHKRASEGGGKPPRYKLQSSNLLNYADRQYLFIVCTDVNSHSLTTACVDRHCPRQLPLRQHHLQLVHQHVSISISPLHRFVYDAATDCGGMYTNI